MSMESFVLSREVRQARESGRAMVALESTIIAHGMPYPQNLQTARQVEQTIRGLGAVPATVAILEGRIHVGLEDAELERIAREPEVSKVSRRDLAYTLATHRHGATTVAGTMVCAHLAGIEVFVTGGIGGVHRGASSSFDVSADLLELAQTPVTVVCAGAKSILDLGLTLEVLETQGVPVISREQDNFAAFYYRDSGHPASARLDDVADMARLIHTQRKLGLKQGIVVSNPVPAEAEMPASEVEGFISQALAEAQAQGVQGKAVTPFLLSRIQVLSAGRSLATNIALVLHNAEVGARLALALQRV